MAKQTINLGTSANKGDGDPLRTAFDKVNDNFDEVYGLLGAEGGDTDDVVAPMLVHNDHTNVTVTRDDAANKIIFSVDQAVTDLKGSVFADDSTLLVDGVAGKIVGDIKNSLIETDNITALPGASDLFIQGGADSGTPGNRARVNIGTTNTSTIILGAGDTDIYFNGTPGSSVVAGRLIGDLTGSVFGDDSTLLVDGVNGKIVGDVDITGGNRIDLDTDNGFYITNTDINTYALTVAYTSNLHQLTASGAVSLASTLSVTGNTALGGNLDVAGDSSTIGNSSVTGNEDIAGTLSVTGTATLANDASIGGNLSVAGNTDFNGTVDFSDATVDWQPYVSDVIINNGLPVGTRFTQPAPTTSNGSSGDTSGTVAFDSNYIYYCTAHYTDGVADIWKRVAWSGDTW